MGNLLSWILAKGHHDEGLRELEEIAWDAEQTNDKAARMNVHVERLGKAIPMLTSAFAHAIRRMKESGQYESWKTEETMWRGIVELASYPSATIRVFNDRGEEAFRSPVRTEDVDGHRSIISTQPVPTEIRASKYEIGTEDGERLFVAAATGFTPAGSPFRVEFRID